MFERRSRSSRRRRRRPRRGRRRAPTPSSPCRPYRPCRHTTPGAWQTASCAGYSTATRRSTIGSTPDNAIFSANVPVALSRGDPPPMQRDDPTAIDPTLGAASAGPPNTPRATLPRRPPTCSPARRPLDHRPDAGRHRDEHLPRRLEVHLRRLRHARLRPATARRSAEPRGVPASRPPPRTFSPIATHGYPEVDPGVPFLFDWSNQFNYDSATAIIDELGVAMAVSAAADPRAAPPATPRRGSTTGSRRTSR